MSSPQNEWRTVFSNIWVWLRKLNMEYNRKPNLLLSNKQWIHDCKSVRETISPRQKNPQFWTSIRFFIRWRMTLEIIYSNYLNFNLSINIWLSWNKLWQFSRIVGVFKIFFNLYFFKSLTCPVCLRFLFRGAAFLAECLRFLLGGIIVPLVPNKMIPDSFLVLKERLISVPTSKETGCSSTKPGLEKLTVWMFCRKKRTRSALVELKATLWMHRKISELK